MYFDENRTCLREYMLVDWLVDHEQGYCFQPFIFWHIDIANKSGLKPFCFDTALFGFSKWGAMPWNDWTPGESVTSDLEPAGDCSEGFESVTEDKTCVICGSPMDEKRSHAVTCSPKCRKSLSRRLRAFPPHPPALTR